MSSPNSYVETPVLNVMIFDENYGSPRDGTDALVRRDERNLASLCSRLCEDRARRQPPSKNQEKLCHQTLCLPTPSS